MKVLIGVLSYNDLHFLRQNMPALAEIQKNLNAKVVVCDNALSDETQDFFAQHYPQFEYFRPNLNLGYGNGNNEILRNFPGYDYYICHTNDVILDAKIVKNFIGNMEKDKSIAMCAGKLNFWNVESGEKTKKIDSLGIVATKKHHFYDRGHGEEDNTQHDENVNKFFGISGAVFIIRISVIKKLHTSEYTLFDPRMWMYKEDIDLAYRLRWLGEKITIFPEVWSWHARTAKKGEDKKHYVLLNSYKDHILLLKNNFSLAFGFGIFLRVFFYEFQKAIYMLILHPSVFFEGMKILFFEKASHSKRLISPKEMLNYFK